MTTHTSVQRDELSTPPRLTDLPAPPPDKVGWPWTEPAPVPSTIMPDGISWPRISVVTPSFEQGQFLEETMRSVLLQGYPNLEYWVVDGGSRDGSLDIIKKYSPWLTGWISEPDRGQAHALNKGFAMCTGQLLGWINSDDLLLPGALPALALAYRQNPHALLMGPVQNFDTQHGFSWLVTPKNVTQPAILRPWHHNFVWHQPGFYFPRSVFAQVGSFDESFRYIFDQDWLYRALTVAPVQYLTQPLAKFRYHPASKTVAEASHWAKEDEIFIRRYLNIAQSDWPLVQAALEVRRAEISLRAYSLNRKQGVIHLMNALRTNRKIITLRLFWLLTAKAITPHRIMVYLRPFYLRQKFRQVAPSRPVSKMNP
ncbi:MAG: glycosyltransferase [Anaerolineae bacterium]|nr:glycosyltransferase [Anaerolineae bacterium]